MRNLFSVVVAVTTMFMSVRLSAQTQSDFPVARLLLVEGPVYLNDKPIDTADLPMALPDSAVVRTGQSRLTVELKRGGWLFVDSGSSVRVLGNRPYNFNRLEMLEGRAIVISGTSTPLVDCARPVQLSSRGVFRFAQLAADEWGEQACESRVFEGAAAFPLSSVTVALRPGQSIRCGLKCGDMRPVKEFSPTQVDEFDQWARQLYEQIRVTRR